ncbi:MAG TPA: hypothetical protein VFN28_04345 [Amaricoccus sp.]|nr:hypothetical protein [Amaricoccus sp.]
MRPRFLRALLPALLAALLVAVPLVLLALAVETRPLVHEAGPPDARAAAQARDVIDRLRTLASSDGAVAGFSTDEGELNGVLAAAQRVTRGLEGRAEVTSEGLEVALSIGAPLMPDGLWLNLRGVLAPSSEGLEIVSARVGRLPVPPALVLAAGRMGLDYVLGDGLGGAAVAVVGRVEVDPPRVTLRLSGDPAVRADFFDRLKARALGDGTARVRLAVEDELRRMRKASRRGELPRQGSVLPHLAAAVGNAARAGGAGRDEMRGALYALALACGDPAFGQLVGVEPGPREIEAAGCDGTTLAGRDDLKRHFVVSAGLYAATASGRVAFGVGELKELLDSVESEGFSFEDMAADAAGVRFATALLAAPPEEWAATAAAMTGEAALMPALDGLAEGLDAAAFEARFGGVDSAEYAAVLAEIERRVAALPLYAPPPATN